MTFASRRGTTAPESRVTGPVRIVGTGLLGTSIGLGLRARGVEVGLDDASPTNVSIAVDYGAGVPFAALTAEPRLVVVCVPPDVTAQLVARELDEHPDAVVTDVASVKLPVLRELGRHGVDVSRYVGSHPLAGRERGGPLAGRADLFLGRPWVVCAHQDTGYDRSALVESLILDLGATVVEMSAREHDESVALVSHVPQLVATLMARQLIDAPNAAVNLAGQGLRDVTRIAASDPELWVQILGSNAESVVPVLRRMEQDLVRVIDTLSSPEVPGTRRLIAEEIAGGNAGVARLPGKHGLDHRYAQIMVMVADSPGELARLFADIGDVGVNLEDFRLDHSPGAPIGLAELSVLPETVTRLGAELAARGWRIAG